MSNLILLKTRCTANWPVVISCTHRVDHTALYRLPCIMAARVKDRGRAPLGLIVVWSYLKIFNLCCQHFLLIVVKVVLVCSAWRILQALRVAVWGILLSRILLDACWLFWVPEVWSRTLATGHRAPWSILPCSMQLARGYSAVVIEEGPSSIAHLNRAFNIHMYILVLPHDKIWRCRTIGPGALVHFLVGSKTRSHQQRRDPSSSHIFRAFPRNLSIALGLQHVQL